MASCRCGQDGELGRALADAGGADAPREWSARLRELLRAELERGARELGEARTGRERPIAWRWRPRDGGGARGAAAAAGAARGPGRGAERGGVLAAAAVERLVEATERARRRGRRPALVLGEHDGFLALSYPAADPRWSAEYAREALEDAARARSTACAPRRTCCPAT